MLLPKCKDLGGAPRQPISPVSPLPVQTYRTLAALCCSSPPPHRKRCRSRDGCVLSRLLLQQWYMPTVAAAVNMSRVGASTLEDDKAHAIAQMRYIWLA